VTVTPTDRLRRADSQRMMLALTGNKTISGRQLHHGAPEEALSPGESIRVKKRDGKVFDLRRVDSGGRDILADLDQILEEIPTRNATRTTDLARIIIEDRE
jgi:hypothetical protein